MSTTKHVLRALSGRMRSVFVGRNAPPVVIAEVQAKAGNKKRISAAVLVAVLGSFGLALEGHEVQAIVHAHADNRGLVDWRRLFVALDMGRPSDHTDPDLFLDPLPQPYRTLAALLDREILDAAWAEIVARHPELSTHSVDAERVEVEMELRKECAPSCRKEEDLNAGPGDTATAVQWDQDGQLLFTGTKGGRVEVSRPNLLAGAMGGGSFTALTSIVAFFGSSCSVSCLSTPVGTLQGKAGEEDTVLIAAAGWSVSQPATPGEDAKPNPDTEPDAVAPETPCPEAGFVTVLQVATLDNPAGDPALSFSALCTAELPVPALGLVLSPDKRRLAVSLSDGRLAVWLLPLSWGSQAANLSGGVAVPPSQMAPLAEPHAPRNSQDSVGTHSGPATGREGGGVPESCPLRLAQPELVFPALESLEDRAYATALSEHKQSLSDERLVEGAPSSPPPPVPPLLGGGRRHPHEAHVAFLLSPKAGPASGQRRSGAAAYGQSPQPLTVCLWRSNSNIWWQYTVPAPNERGKASVDVSDGAGGKEGDDGQGLSDMMMTPAVEVAALRTSHWVLSSPVTASTCSGGGGLMAIGTADGSVYVWDASFKAMLEVLGRHKGMVTALAFHGSSFLVTAGTDEMVHFYHLVNKAGVDTSGSGASRTAGYTCSSRDFLTRCRHDMGGIPIVGLSCMSDTPLAFAQDAAGHIAAYNCITGDLLGVLVHGSTSKQAATGAHQEARPLCRGDVARFLQETERHGSAAVGAPAPASVRVDGGELGKDWGKLHARMLELSGVFAAQGDQLAVVYAHTPPAAAETEPLPPRWTGLCVWMAADVLACLKPEGLDSGIATLQNTTERTRNAPANGSRMEGVLKGAGTGLESGSLAYRSKTMSRFQQQCVNGAATPGSPAGAPDPGLRVKQYMATRHATRPQRKARLAKATGAMLQSFGLAV